MTVIRYLILSASFSPAFCCATGLADEAGWKPLRTGGGNGFVYYQGKAK